MSVSSSFLRRQVSRIWTPDQVRGDGYNSHKLDRILAIGIQQRGAKRRSRTGLNHARATALKFYPRLLRDTPLNTALRCSSGMRVKCSTAAIIKSRGDSP